MADPKEQINDFDETQDQLSDDQLEDVSGGGANYGDDNSVDV